eukprot:gene31323-40331_t
MGAGNCSELASTLLEFAPKVRDASGSQKTTVVHYSLKSFPSGASLCSTLQASSAKVNEPVSVPQTPNALEEDVEITPRVCHGQETPCPRECMSNDGTMGRPLESNTESDLSLYTRPSSFIHSTVRTVSRVMSSLTCTSPDVISDVRPSTNPSGTAMASFPATCETILGGGIGDIELNEESARGNTEFAVGVVPAVPWVDEGDVCDDGLSANAQTPDGINVPDMSNHTEENSTSSNTSRSTSGKCGMTLTGNAEVDGILYNPILDEFSTTFICGEEEMLDTSTCDGSVELHYDTELPLYEVEGAVESDINQSYSGYWPTIEKDIVHHANYFNSLKEHQ